MSPPFSFVFGHVWPLTWHTFPSPLKLTAMSSRWRRSWELLTRHWRLCTPQMRRYISWLQKSVYVSDAMCPFVGDVQTIGECCPLPGSGICILEWKCASELARWSPTEKSKRKKKKKKRLLLPALVVFNLFLPSSSFHPIPSSFHLPFAHLTIHFQVSFFCKPHESYLLKWHDLHARITRFGRCAYLSYLPKSEAFMFHNKLLKTAPGNFQF